MPMGAAGFRKRLVDSAESRREVAAAIREELGGDGVAVDRSLTKAQLKTAFLADPEQARTDTVVDTLPDAVAALRVCCRRGERWAVQTVFRLAKWLDVDRNVVLNVLMTYGVGSERELRTLVDRARSVEDVTDEQAQLQCAEYLAACARRGELSSDALRLVLASLPDGAPGVGDDPGGGVQDKRVPS